MRTGGRTDRHTDMTKLIVAFRNFAKAPKMNYEARVLFAYNDLQVKSIPPPFGESLTTYVILFWVEVGRRCFTLSLRNWLHSFSILNQLLSMIDKFS
jgi:hypothetical protein